MLPALTAIASEVKLPISIDTYHAEVAVAAAPDGTDAVNCVRLGVTMPDPSHLDPAGSTSA